MAKPTSRGQTKEVVFPSPERRTDLLIHALNGVGSDNFQDRMKGTIFNGRFFLGNPRSLMVVVKRLQKWSTLKPGKITEGADGFPRCSNEEYMRQLVGLRRLLRTRYVAYPAIT